MVFYSALRKSLFISLLGHMAVFTLFSLTFGTATPMLNSGKINFWGSILSNSDFARAPYLNIAPDSPKTIFKKKAGGPALKNTGGQNYLNGQYYIKPQGAPQSFFRDKKYFMPASLSNIPVPAKRGPVIMFYPKLPYNFTLYFKDRQTVHIELMFNLVSREEKNSIVIKRKVSSGNLEADLLCMRYISRYLLTERMGFPLDAWQAVKIDLSAKND